MQETAIATPAAEGTEPGSDLLVIEEAARLLGHTGEPDYAISALLRLLAQRLGLNRGRVLLPDAESGSLLIRYSYGLSAAEQERGVYAMGEGVTGQVMKSGQVAIIQDIDEEPRYLARAVPRSSLAQETVAYIAVPLMRDDTVIGVLAAHRLRRRDRSFNTDLAILRVVATLIAQILQINRLIGERTAQLVSENRSLKNALDSRGAHYGILGNSAALSTALRQAHRVADTAASVLLSGEPGTGKEKFARMLHLASSRCDGPFVTLNCAALPAEMLESELFGQDKAGFPGAARGRKGKLELASGGTLFLNEIGALDFDLQAKLLRVLEEQAVQRGGGRDIRVDVRIVAATHTNLQQAVDDGRFRVDLFYRLNVFPIRLPALRERLGDVRLLARHFISAANHDYERNLVLGPGVLERLESCPWPGNVRQLESVIKRAVLTAGDEQIGIADIDAILAQEQSAPQTAALSLPPLAVAGGVLQGASLRPYSWVRQDEADGIRGALRDAGGNKTRAALALGLTPRQLRYRLDKLGIEAT